MQLLFMGVSIINTEWQFNIKANDQEKLQRAVKSHNQTAFKTDLGNHLGGDDANIADVLKK